jgi:hypothetical protein
VAAGPVGARGAGVAGQGGAVSCLCVCGCQQDECLECLGSTACAGDNCGKCHCVRDSCECTTTVSDGELEPEGEKES